LIRSGGSSGGSGPAGVGGGRALPDKIGPYPVKGHLGGGGQGDVYLGFHPHFEIEVAIKVLNEAFRQPEQLERIKVEAQTMVRLAAPNVVRVFDFNLEGPYLVMEYCRDGDLTHYIMTRRRRPLSETVSVVRQICEALIVAHEHDPPILHRDIKPANVLFQKGVPKVTDFGLAKMLGGGSGLTSTRGPMGTPRYMSPEQLQDASRVDQRTDLWSVGIILYELLTWSRPFDKSGDTYFNIMLRTRTEPPRKPPYDLPAPIMAVILKALEKEPDDRFRSAREMRDALDQAVRAIPDAGQLILPPEELVDDISRLSARVAERIESGNSQDAFTLVQEICQIAPEHSVGRYWRKKFKDTGQTGSSSGGAIDTGRRGEADWVANEVSSVEEILKGRDYRRARQRVGEILIKYPDNTVVQRLLETIRKEESDLRQDLDDAHRAADAAREKNDFRRLHEIWAELDRKYPDYRDIKAELVVAAREREIAEQREARQALDAVVAERRRSGDLGGAIDALRRYTASYPQDHEARRALVELEETLRAQVRSGQIAALRAQTEVLRGAGRLQEAVALWETCLREDPEAAEAARELQAVRDGIAALERQRRLGITRARAGELAGRQQLRAALDAWEAYRADYPDESEAAAEIVRLEGAIAEARRGALQAEIDRFAAQVEKRLAAGRYSSLTGAGADLGAALRAARTPTGDPQALDALRRRLIAATDGAENRLAEELAGRRARVEGALAELSEWLPAGPDIDPGRALPAEQDLRRAMAAGLAALCDLLPVDGDGDPIERMEGAARELAATSTALARSRQQALDEARAAARQALDAACTAAERLAPLARENLESAEAPASLGARLEQLSAQIDSKVPERLIAVAGQLNSVRDEAEARLAAARFDLCDELAALLHRGRGLLVEAPAPALQDLIGRTVAALREEGGVGKGSDRALVDLGAALRRELEVAAASLGTRLEEARRRWQAALSSWREVLSADLGSSLDLEARKIEIAGDTSLASSRAEDLAGWAAQLEGLTRRYRLESAWIEHANDVLEIEGPLGSDGLPHEEPGGTQRKLLVDYRKALAAGDGGACRALGPALKQQAGDRQAGGHRAPGDLPPVPPLSGPLRRFNETYSPGNLRRFDELASRYEKSRSQGRAAEASRLQEELETAYRTMLRPPPIWRGAAARSAVAAALLCAVAWYIVVPPEEPTSVTILSPAGDVEITEVRRDGEIQSGLAGRITEEGRTWSDLSPGRYTVGVAGGRQFNFDVPGQSFLLLPSEEVDYPAILLRELGLERAMADADS
jgi:serine/threonine protein kinase